MSAGTLMILNGTSSAGKSSVQRALMDRADEPWLAAGVDLYFPKIIGQYNASEPPADQGILWVGEQPEPPFHLTGVQVGPVGQRFFRGIFAGMRAFLEQGLNVVSDQCLWDQWLVDDCVRAFEGIDAWMVHCNPPAEVSEVWERQRTDKQIYGMTRTIRSMMRGVQVQASTRPPARPMLLLS